MHCGPCLTEVCLFFASHFSSAGISVRRYYIWTSGQTSTYEICSTHIAGMSFADTTLRIGAANLKERSRYTRHVHVLANKQRLVLSEKANCLFLTIHRLPALVSTLQPMPMPRALIDPYSQSYPRATRCSVKANRPAYYTETGGRYRRRLTYMF